MGAALGCNGPLGPDLILDVPELRDLKRLTQLHISDNSADSNMQQLPSQLQQLTAVYGAKEQGVVVNLVHLQQLRQLYLSGNSWGVGSALPSQLQQQTASCSARAEQSIVVLLGISRLRQLTSLQLNESCDPPEQLLQLAEAPKLQELSLLCKFIRNVGYVDSQGPAAWRNVPQLRTLNHIW